jgi:hypothetical protein
MDWNQSRDTQAAVSMGLHCVKASATLPATTDQTLFTISGGNVFVTLLIGEVSTVFQNSDPVLTVVADPTTGTNVTLASTVDTTSLEAGGWLLVEGDGTAIVIGDAGMIPVTGQYNFVVGIGAIILHSAATKTGATKWDLFWHPLDEGAAVTSG